MRITNLFMRATLWATAICTLSGVCVKAQSIKATTSTDASAQSTTTARSRYVISARAGAINFVSGEAMWRHQDESDPRRLTTNDDLQSGDKVETGANGFVEMLLSPGTYLRIGSNSTVELTNANLDDLRVTIAKGSIVVEATGLGDAETSTRFNTPQTSVLIAQNGLYRINVSTQATEVLVRKGEARGGSETAATIVKKNKKLMVYGNASATPMEVASFDKKSQDALDLWSKERAETLADLNSQLASANLGNAVAGFVNSNWYWQSYYGLWAYNSLYGCYTFLPFRYCNSPYGFNYNWIVFVTPVFRHAPKPNLPVHLPHPPNRVAGGSVSIVNNARHSGNASPTTMSDVKTHTQHTMPVHTEPTHATPSHQMTERTYSAPSTSVYSTHTSTTTSTSSGRSGKPQ